MNELSRGPIFSLLHLLHILQAGVPRQGDSSLNGSVLLVLLGMWRMTMVF